MIAKKVLAPVMATLVVVTLGTIVLASYAGGASSAGGARSQWTPTPSTAEGITADALQAYARANFGSAGAKGGVALWWPTVTGMDVRAGYAIAHTTLHDTAKDIRMAIDVCVALVYFANDKGRKGMKLTHVKVTGVDGLVLIDTTADASETDPCQSFRARPTRARD